MSASGMQSEEKGEAAGKSLKPGNMSGDYGVRFARGMCQKSRVWSPKCLYTCVIEE